ncbi:MAG: tetratricopeptide repeat protein [Planctomycetota bacterium]
MSPRSHKTALGLGLVLLATLAVYAPSLRNGFAMDDLWIARPADDAGRPLPLVGRVAPLRDYFGANYHAVSGHLSELYRPVTILSYALVNAAQRPGMSEALQAAPHHALNLFLHLVATGLVYSLVRDAGGGRRGGLIAAAVFGLHGIHSEVVANVVGRAELLGFVGGAMATRVWVDARPGGRTWSVMARAVVAASLLFLAFGAKESALAWAGWLPLYAVVRGRAALPAVALAVVPAAVYLGLRTAMIAALPGAVPPIEWAANPLAQVDTVTRVCTGLCVWGYGLAMTLLPFGALRADYGPPTFGLASSLVDVRVLGATAGLLAVAVGALLAGRRRPLLLLAGAAFLGFSCITSNLPFAVGTIFGERLYYTPSLGVALAGASVAGAVARWPRLAQSAAALTLLAWLGLSAGQIWRRNPVWRSDEALFLAEAAHEPPSVRMLVCAAEVVRMRGDLARAETLLRRAVALAPDYALAWNNLGATLLNLDQLDEAEAALLRARRARQALPAGQEQMIEANLAAVRDARPPR